MPRIPIYEQQVVPNASRGNIRAGNAVVDSRGLAAGLDRIQGALDRRAEVDYALEKDRIETEGRIWAAKASSQADLDMAEHMKKLQEAAEPGASGFTPSYLKDYDSYANGALKNAPSAYARNILQAHIARSREAYGKAAMSYEAQERTRHMGQQVDEGVQMSATLLAAQPGLFESEMGKWESTIRGLAIDPGAKAKLRDIAKNTLVTSTIKGWIDQNPNVAAKVLDAWQKGVEPGEQPMFDVNIGGKQARLPLGMLDVRQRQELLSYAGQKEREFETETLANAFIGAARSAVERAPFMAGGEAIDLPAAKQRALEAVRTSGIELDEKQRLQLEGYVEKIASDKERDHKRRRDASMASVFSQLDENGGDYQAVLAANPWMANQSAEFRERVNNYAGNVALGGTRATDWQAYNALIEDPALLKATNLDAMKDKFNSSEFVQLKKLQAGLNENMPEQEVRTTTSLLNDMLDDAGYKRNETKQARFFSLLQEAVDQELAASGKKKLPQARIKELAADLLVKDVTSKGVLFDTQKRGVAIEVPPAERIKIEAALAEAGMPVNEYNVLQAYRNKLRKLNK